MVKILEVDEVVSHIVETDRDDWSTYRRNGPDCWEIAMGESWEQKYNCEELEEAFQAWQVHIL